MSGGYNGFPKEKCAEIIIYASAKWAASSKNIEKIRLTNINASTVKYF